MLIELIQHAQLERQQVMNPIARNILVVIVGLVAGCAVNLGLVNLGPVVVPLPEGADVSSFEGLKESMKLFKPANFLFPFLGHAVGTLVAALVIAKFVTTSPMRFAVGVGAFFLLGGITMVVSVGGPMWFIVADLVVAYIPMGLLGGMLAGGRPEPAETSTEKPE